MAGKRRRRTETRPAPAGLRLTHTLNETEGEVNGLGWSPDGSRLAAACQDGRLRVFDAGSGDLLHVLVGHDGPVNSISWSPDSRRLASGGRDATLRVWDAASGELLRDFSVHSEEIWSVAWSTNGGRLASAGGTTRHSSSIVLVDPRSGRLLRTLSGHSRWINCVAWSPGDRWLASASGDDTVGVWNARTGKCRLLSGHYDQPLALAFSPKDSFLVSGGDDSTLRVWDLARGTEVKVLEGHTGRVISVSFSHDGRLLASKSSDGTVRLWRCDRWETVEVLDEPAGESWPPSVAFHPKAARLATLGGNDRLIRLWEVDLDTLLGSAPEEPPVRYTTARIVLVGDTGVGKTGLAWRLAHGEFKDHPSTHGQQFWVLRQLGARRADAGRCEAVLWDLAGQADYRIVNTLFLDDLDIGVLVFDASRRDRPLGGVEFWLQHLSSLPNSPGLILVAARTDRGAPPITAEDLEAFCRNNRIKGGFLATSALRGDGVDELVRRLVELIDWEKMPATISTEAFQRVKEHIFAVREGENRPPVLIRLEALGRQLDSSGPPVLPEELATAVRHLESHGYIKALRGSAGESFVLMFPQMLANLASSIVLAARANDKGLGALDEERLLSGGYAFPELEGLGTAESRSLLDAVTTLFLERNLCFRTRIGEQRLLVFPGLINERQPPSEERTVAPDAAYQVRGAVENVYASLVVLLGYTNVFTRTHQWQGQAQYEVGEGEVCGFRLTREGEGELELVLYYGESTSQDSRLIFQGAFQKFLKRPDLKVWYHPPVDCPRCRQRQERAAVESQRRQGRTHVHCQQCGERIVIPSPEDLTPPPSIDPERVEKEVDVAQRRSAFEAALVQVHRLAGSPPRPPTCFISYAWTERTRPWTLALAEDLRSARIDVVFDQWQSPTCPLPHFVHRISESDFVVVVCTPEVKEKYERAMSGQADSVLAAELDLIQQLRFRQSTHGRRVVPILREGSRCKSIPSLLEPIPGLDFTVEDHYFLRLLDLVLILYGVPFDTPSLDELRKTLR